MDFYGPLGPKSTGNLTSGTGTRYSKKSNSVSVLKHRVRFRAKTLNLITDVLSGVLPKITILSHVDKQ